MNGKNITFDDIYHLEAVMRVFGKTTPTSIMGTEPSRLRNKFGWHVYQVYQKLAFGRREIQATALLLDAIDAGRLPKPYAANMWPGWVRSYMSDANFENLLKAVQSAALPQFHRALLEAAIIDEELPSGIPIKDFWTIEQMCGSIGISRESVYKRSDIRLGPGLGLKTVEFSGMHLWYPLNLVETV